MSETTVSDKAVSRGTKLRWLVVLFVACFILFLYIDGHHSTATKAAPQKAGMFTNMHNISADLDRLYQLRNPGATIKNTSCSRFGGGSKVTCYTTIIPAGSTFVPKGTNTMVYIKLSHDGRQFKILQTVSS